MKAFAITCTTCQKRLRVRDATAIGQIMICPHCSSMVLVQPDEPASAPADAPPTGSASSASSPPPARSPAPSAASPTAPAETPPAAWEEPPADSPPAEPPLPAKPPLAPLRSRKKQNRPLPLPDNGEPLLPDQAWQSTTLQQRQQWLLLAFAALVGASLAVGLLGFLAVQMSRRERPTPTQAAAPDPSPEPDDRAPSPPDDSEADARQEVQANYEEKNDQEGEEVSEDEDRQEERGNQEEEDIQDKQADQEERDGQEQQPDSADPTEADGLPRIDQEQPQLADAPSEPDPAEAADVETPPSQADGAESAPARSLAETLDVFGDLIEDAPFEPAHETPAAEDPNLPTGAPRARSAIRVPQPEMPAIDIAARLDDPISGLQLSEVPLLTFVRFMSRMTTIPISLDPDALALLRRDVRTPVTVQLVEGRVQEVLENALRPLGLAPIRVGDQLRVTRPSPATGPVRFHRHPVQDLVGEDPQQIEQLADWILRFVAPESWETAGGTGRLETDLPNLEIHQQDTLLFRVLLFCERLRVARELPRTTTLDPELCRLEPRVDRAQQRLQQPLHLVQRAPERMLELLEQITAQTDLQILVDWPALAEIGWTPAAEMTFQADGQPLGEILAEMLQPLGLTYRVLDAATIQITTPEAVYRQWDVEFYRWEPQPGAAEHDGDRLSALREALEVQGLTPAEFALEVEPVSQSLIAALPQPYHRWLQAWLADDSQPPP